MLNSRRRVVDRSTIERANENHKSTIRHYERVVKKVKEDKEKKKRKGQQLCPMCFYTSNGWIGGQACTEYQCAFCDRVEVYGNTATPIACQECAKTADICVRCGADMNLINRRKRNLPARSETRNLEEERYPNAYRR